MVGVAGNAELDFPAGPALETICDPISRICIYDEAIEESRLRTDCAEAFGDAWRSRILQRGRHRRALQDVHTADGESAAETGEGRVGGRAARFGRWLHAGAGCFIDLGARCDQGDRRAAVHYFLRDFARGVRRDDDLLDSRAFAAR